MSRTARTYTSVEQWVCAKRANEWVIVVQRQIKKNQLYQGENKLYYLKGCPHCTRLLRQRFRTGGNNIVEVFWEFDNKFLNDGHIVVLWVFRVIWCTITFNVILTITNAINKNLHSSGTKWLPIMTCIHPLGHQRFF
jgi:hypothetical protein